MASGMYDRFKANLYNKEVDLEADTIKVMLLDDSHAFDAAHNVIGDVSANQIEGEGYDAGGKALEGKAVTQGTTTKWDADDIAWTGATFTAYHAVIYDDSLGADDLIASIDLGGAQTVEGQTFTIKWDADGVIILKTAA